MLRLAHIIVIQAYMEITAEVKIPLDLVGNGCVYSITQARTRIMHDSSYLVCNLSLHGQLSSQILNTGCHYR